MSSKRDFVWNPSSGLGQSSWSGAVNVSGIYDKIPQFTDVASVIAMHCEAAPYRHRIHSFRVFRRCHDKEAVCWLDLEVGWGTGWGEHRLTSGAEVWNC